MLLEYATKESVLRPEDFQILRKHISVRNKIAHTSGNVTQSLARMIVVDVSRVILAVRAARQRRPPEDPQLVPG